MKMDISLMPIFVVSVIWGITNPLMKVGASKTLRRSGKDTASQPRNFVARTLKDLFDLFCGAAYLLPFLINQCGSMLFYFCLISRTEDSKLSVLVPVVNAMTFVFTAIFANIFNSEEIFTLRKISGLILIVSGVYLTTV